MLRFNQTSRATPVTTPRGTMGTILHQIFSAMFIGEPMRYANLVHFLLPGRQSSVTKRIDEHR